MHPPIAPPRPIGNRPDVTRMMRFGATARVRNETKQRNGGRRGAGQVLKKQERDSRPPRVAFAPSGHPKLSNARVAASSAAGLAAFQRRRAGAVVVAVTGRCVAAARRQTPEVQVVLQQRHPNVSSEHGKFFLSWGVLARGTQ